LKRAVFTKGSLLYDEGHFLLREELREPSTYLALLKHLAAGLCCGRRQGGSN